jgi:membrane-associated protein
MTSLSALHGTLAMFVVWALLFAEESGVPLPLVPGDILLVASGVMIRTGAIPALPFIPIAVVVATAGALAGFTWARLLGRRGVRELAQRFRMGSGLERIEKRLRATGPVGVFVARLLIPGMRVNTTLIAGAMNVPRRAFIVGLVPAVAIWVPAMTGLGVAAGIPLETAFIAVDNVMIEGVEVLAVGIVGYLVARHVPSRGHAVRSAHVEAAWQRLALALAVDLAIVATFVAALEVIGASLLQVRYIDDLPLATLGVGIAFVAYLVGTRRSLDVTAGEAAFGVSYRASHHGGPVAAGKRPPTPGDRAPVHCVS